MQKPRGTRDLYGREMKLIRKVLDSLIESFRRYGYEEIETPIFERLELFTQKSGSEVLDQIYHFEDKSQRELALRPELTAPAIRLYNNELKSEPKPQKLYYCGPCFRYERPQAGRWRQFLQAGIELIGSGRPEADAEVIALTEDCFESLEFENYSLEIGNIGLLRHILSKEGIKGEDQDPILRAVDSEEEERIEKELDRSDASDDLKDMLFSLISLRGGHSVIDEVEDVLGVLKDVEETLDNFELIIDMLDSIGVDYVIDFGIARGLEYYTDTVFEVYCGDVQIGGGGRYDGLIEALGGDPTSAVGVGLGIDRIASFLEDQGGYSDSSEIDIAVLPTADEMVENALEISRILRKIGFRVDMDLRGRNLSKSLKHADSKGARYSLIVGSRDISDDKVTLRDMKTGDQTKIGLGKLETEISSLLD
ncbi:MAG: histidine--tRNA ligase [Candidatus Hadarchaeota archaeon]